jgi:hypothetical protein
MKIASPYSSRSNLSRMTGVVIAKLRLPKIKIATRMDGD